MADNARTRFLKLLSCIQHGSIENAPADLRTDLDKQMYACALDNDDWDDEKLAYVVGSTPYAIDWLSLTDGGSALTPETGILYIIASAGTYLNRLYRWNGTTYTDVSPSLVIGTTTGTAFDGGVGHGIDLALNAIGSTIYVDGDIGSDENSGTAAYPVKTIGGAIALANTLTDAEGFTFHIAHGTYIEDEDITLPDKFITIYGNNSEIRNTGHTITIPNPSFIRYNLVTTSDIVYSTFMSGARSVVFGGAIIGNITNNSYVEFTQCQLISGVITTGATGQTVCALTSPTSKFVSTGVLILDKLNINTNYAGYLVTSTAGQLTVSNSIIFNGSTNALAGAVSCNNGATTAPNFIANNALTTAGSAYGLYAGTAVTVYSKNYIVATNTVIGSALLPVNTDITGAGNVMALGGDATGDLYYRNALGVLTKLPIGTTGQVLKVVGGVPAWADA